MTANSTSKPNSSAAEQASAALDTLILVAEIGAPHGVRGLVKLKVHTENPAALKTYPLTDKKGRSYELRHLQPGPKGMVAGFKGATTREAAEALRNIALYTPRAALPALQDEDDFYITDLMNLEVLNEAGSSLGRVRSVQNFGAGDLLDIISHSGASGFLPFTKAFVPVVSISTGQIIIAPDEDFLKSGKGQPQDDGIEG
jgi:16S rRNA processing protein RimM